MITTTTLLPAEVAEKVAEAAKAREAYMNDFATSISVVLNRGIFTTEERQTYFDQLMALASLAADGMYIRGLGIGAVSILSGMTLEDMLSDEPSLSVIPGGKDD